MSDPQNEGDRNLLSRFNNPIIDDPDLPLAEFFDAGKRIRYQVDSDLGLTEYIYDGFGRKMAEVTYKAFLTTAELAAIVARVCGEQAGAA